MQVAQSLATRAKYRLDPRDSGRMPLRLLGAHPENRSGAFPVPGRVIDLMCNILLKGFSPEEAGHAGVCVQDLPLEHHEAYLAKWGKPYKTLHAYNRDKVKDMPQLRRTVTGEVQLQYGTLSHTTLTVGLNCLRTGATWELPVEHQNKGLEQLRKQPGGEWCRDALARRDPALGKALDLGLPFEVLSWRLWMEEAPGTCAAISHALNTPQAMAMVTHEMEALRTLVELVDGERACRGRAPGAVDFERVKEGMRRDHAHFVEQAGWQDMFEFVLNSGGNSQYIGLLMDFDRRFVDHKKRQLPLEAFREVNKLNATLPRTQVALLIRAYSKEPTRGVCPAPEPVWGKLRPELLLSLEVLLRYFQEALAPTAAKLGADQALLTQCNVCMWASEAFVQHSKPGDDRAQKPRAEMLQATLKYYEQVCAAAQDAPLPDPPEHWMDWKAAAAKASEATAAEAPAAAQPLLIRRDAQDRPMNENPVTGSAAEPPPPIVLPVEEWFGSQKARELDTNHYHQSALAVVLATFHAQDASVRKPVQVRCDPRTSKYWAVATQDLGEGELQLVPAAPTTKRFPLSTNDPRAVAISITRTRPEPKEGPFPYCLQPDWKAPQCKPAAASSAAGADAAATVVPGEPADDDEAPAAAGGQAYEFRFDGAESIHLFWAVERLTEQELLLKRAQDSSCRNAEFNMAVQTKVMNVIVSGWPSRADGLGATAMVAAVDVPVLVNTKPVKAGERLLLGVEAAARKAAKPEEAWKKAQREQESKNSKGAKPAAKRPKLLLEETVTVL